MSQYHEEEAGLVSVIMPSYNRKETIGRAIQSVINQTYQNWELIIVDDASADDTEEAVNSFKDGRIIYLRNEVNRGANYSRNKGIRNASGEYIAFLDSDNTWRQDKLEKQTKLIRCGTDMVYSAYNFYNGNNCRKLPVLNYPVDFYDRRLCEVLTECNVVDTSTIIVRKSFLDEIGLFDEEMPRHQDYELAVRIAEHGTVQYIDEALADVYRMKQSISNNHKALFKSIVLMLKKHRGFFMKNNGISRHFQLGLNYCVQRKLGLETVLSYLQYIRSELFAEFPEAVWELWEAAFQNLNADYEQNCEMFKQYANNIQIQIRSGIKFAVYGAGVRAINFYDGLSDTAKDNLKYFVVSDKKGNADFISDKRVIGIDELGKEDKDILILIAMKRNYYTQVKELLETRGFSNYILVT